MKTIPPTTDRPLTPERARIREEWKQVAAELHAAAKRAGTDNMTMDEINAEIQAMRRERAARYAHA